MTPDPHVSLRLLGENMESDFFYCIPWRSLVEVEEDRVLVGISKQGVPRLAVCDPVTERWSIYEIVIDANGAGRLVRPARSHLHRAGAPVAGLRLDPAVRVGQPVPRRPGGEAYREHVIRPNASDRRDQEHLCDGASHESVRNSE